MISRACGLVETIGFQRRRDFRHGARRFRHDPFVDGEVTVPLELAFCARIRSSRRSARVPELGAEIAAGLDAIEAETDVAPLPRRDSQRKAQRVGAIFIDVSSGSTTLPFVLDIFCPFS